MKSAYKVMDRLSWSRFYWKRFDMTGAQQAKVLALWYQLLSLGLKDD